MFPTGINVYMSVLIKETKRVRYYSSYDSVGRSGAKDYRIMSLGIFFLLFALVIIFRLYKLQLVEGAYYTALASDQHEIFKQLYPERGKIYLVDKKIPSDNEVGYYPVALNKSLNLLYAVPAEVKDPDAVFGVLLEVFNLQNVVEQTKSEPEKKEVATEVAIPILSEKEIKKLESDKALVSSWNERLRKERDPYEPLKHLVTDAEMEKIKSFNLEGVHSTPEQTRFYPEHELASQLIGFVGKQAENNTLKGYEGIESCYDKTLAGEPGFLRSELDSAGRMIATAGEDLRDAEDGADIYLTIDKAVEYYACNELNKAVKQFGASRGSLVAMEPQTGRIIALCNSPEFDPNKYNEVEDASIFNNNAIFESYEPGSVFKPLTMAAALDAGKVDPFTTYVDRGELFISKFRIGNSIDIPQGVTTMTQVLEKSLNTGAVFAAQQVGLPDFKRYVEAFGFGKKTEIDLCGEDAGNITSLNDPNPVYLATASFGQGIMTTPIQLVRAYAAMANDGKLMEPYVVEKIIKKNGTVVQEKKPKIVGQVISPQSSKLIKSMMVSAVNNGYGKLARVPGYLVGGKTGTAQIADSVKGGYSNDFNHTFVGVMPFNNPRLAMVIKLERVKNVPFAESSATPLFGKVAKFIMDYYNVPTEE
ncbi:MAG: Peptidoglycan glycosyltransferase [Parcubacteria group bacterium GW2011_GWC2_39_14]|nr:MAG: Peptidoglycan glycosyltransferase [Parcubacteria group bacterium GW2011_GWC2_39_14]KKR54455.1 MAG: Peptidoglycan glycosyltransferase [Parcubacteria group bacterium GW2011_GWA2_40_23]